MEVIDTDKTQMKGKIKSPLQVLSSPFFYIYAVKKGAHYDLLEYDGQVVLKSKVERLDISI